MFSKKALVIIGVVVLMLLLGLVAIFFTTQNQNEFEIGGRRAPESANSQQFTDELLDAYTIDYPPDWNAEQRRVAGGGTNTTFTIPGATEDAPPGLVTIQGVSSDEAPVGKVESIFESLGYTKEIGSVQGIPAARFIGSLNKLHEIAYVVEKDTMVYTIRLSYVSDSTDNELQTQFNEVVDTFSFN